MSGMVGVVVVSSGSGDDGPRRWRYGVLIKSWSAAEDGGGDVTMKIEDVVICQ